MKKILLGIYLFAALFFVGSLTGCVEKECKHQEETITGVAATCTEKGLTDGKKCSICQEILVAQEEIPALGHTEETITGFAATCTEKGLTDGKKCSVCQEILVAQEEIAVLGHTLEQVEAKEATCTETGNVAYGHCSVCEKNFDAEGNELENVVIAALGHTLEQVEAKEATCEEAGNVAYEHCSVCEKNFDAEGNELENVVIAALGHTLEQVEAKEATCTETGNVAHEHCSVCEKNFDAEGNQLENVTIEALGHYFIDGKCECGEVYVEVLGDWSLVTEIKNGDQVLIGAPAYNKLLSVNKVSTYYNKGVDYSLDNFTNVTDAEIFVVTVNDDGTYTFTSVTGVAIALAESYSSLNDTGVHKSWTLEVKGDGIFYLKNKARGNYLEWYNSKGNWSTYATSSLSDLFELSFYAKSSTGEHVHNYITDVHETTCTEDGYTTYTCKCGDSYTKEGQAATGHKYTAVVTAPTCTEDGYTTYTCTCNDSYVEAGEKAKGHIYVDGKCECGEEDPSLHVHNYVAVVTAPTCTVAGYTTYTCDCGDSYTADEVAVVDHIDTNLDITCDFDGCTKRILPAADSKVSLFTANHMIIVSLSNNYYVEGVIVEITDANNGIFIIEDEAKDQILIRLPKDADGNSYSKWTTRVVVGDTISVYGKPTKNTGSPASQKAKVEGGLLTVLKHEHVFSEATCTKPSVCACLVQNAEALGHIDENADNACDRCSWNMKLVEENIVVATDTTLSNGVLDAAKTSWTWTSENFDVIIAKAASTYTLYTSAKAYMQLKKQNTLTVDNRNGLMIHSITISTTNATQLTNLEKAIGTQYEFTKDADALTITIILDSTEDFVLTNQGTTTAYVSGVEVVYEK